MDARVRLPRRWPAFALAGLLALGAPLGGCSGCGAQTASSSCTTSADCSAGQACVDGRCTAIADGGGVDAGPDAAATCMGGARPCGGTCCASGEVCGTTGTCCARGDLCGSQCCASGETCEGSVCHLDCGGGVRCHDDTGAEVCCTGGEVCASDRCFMPTTSCEGFLDCPADEYCETTLGECLPQPGGVPCEVHPTGGAVTPTLLWHWDGTGAALPTYDQVMMAPMVANMNDDNGDGVVDTNDIPDVVFSTFAGGNYGEDGVLRAVSGADGSSVFDVTDPALRVIAGAQIAIGDIDGDGLPEVVACASAPGGIGPIIAFENDGTFKWRSTDPSVQCGEAAPAIADLDGDGMPEVFVRYTVLHGSDGSLEWHHDCVGTGGWATASHNPCDYTTAADLDGDGQLEVVGGNVAYHADGTVLWDRTADMLDGYPAVGDLDLDGTPEVVVVESAFHPAPYAGDHYLRVLNADGTDRWGPVDINQGHAPASDVSANTVGGGGPPTIANFDDDPEPEIALAGAYGYAVFEPDGTLKWWAPTHDFSSRKTGSSVFDFDGDGKAEAVYNDEYWLRVYDGMDGNVRFCLCNTSATLWEYPVIADVNDDGHAEIVVAENDYAAATSSCPTTVDLDSCTMARIAAGETAGGHGIRVFASPSHDWVATRRIWNEHTYHVTNVSETGAIPAHERANWTTPSLNDFRQNVQPGATNVPDLTPVDLGVDLSACPDQMVLQFRVTNVGWAASPAGVPVTVYVDDGSGEVRLGTVTTTRTLLPGEGEVLSMPYTLPAGAGTAGTTIHFRVVIDDPTDMPLDGLVECRNDNNEAATDASCSIVF